MTQGLYIGDNDYIMVPRLEILLDHFFGGGVLDCYLCHKIIFLIILFYFQPEDRARQDSMNEEILKMQVLDSFIIDSRCLDKSVHS